MIRFAPAALCAALLAVAPALAAAQVPGLSTSKQFKLERLGEDHWRATGEVEMEKDDLRFFADIVDYFPEESRLIASGNVVFVSRDSRIAAERMEFNTKTRTGVFYKGSGTASLGEKVDKTLFGTQEPDAYFYGETLEKLGPKKYRDHEGRLHHLRAADAAVGHHRVVGNGHARRLRHPEELGAAGEGRADVLHADLLLPDQRGGSRHRIPDSGLRLVDHSRPEPVERLLLGHRPQPGRDGVPRLVQHHRARASAASTDTLPHRVRKDRCGPTGSTRRTRSIHRVDGSQSVSPGRRSYEIRANAIQRLPANMRARVNIDYFSDITTQQTYFGNLYDASRRQRVIGGNVAGTWGADSLSFTYNRNQVFFNDTDSTLTGNIPRVLYSRAARKIGPTPLYFSAGGEYARLLRTDEFGGIINEQGLDRIDFGPTVRLPFSKLTYLSLNASAAWRGTMVFGQSRGRPAGADAAVAVATSTCARTSSAPSSRRSGIRPTTATRRATSTSSSRYSASRRSPASTTSTRSSSSRASTTSSATRSGTPTG